MKRIAIIGSGHLGQQITNHIHQDSEHKAVAYFDEFQEKGVYVNGIPILGGNNDILTEFEKKSFDAILIGVGYKFMDFRKEIFEKLNGKIPFHTFIHSSVYLDKTVKIGTGCIIYPRCVLDQNVILEDNILMNISGSIAHDSIVKKHSFLSPNISIAGFVEIEEQCSIGINSTIIDNIKIGKKTQLGGGTVVIKSINKAGLYVGNPARFIK
ncbi:MAG: acetyltransferase [Flavobacterium sp.]|nr:acetyltransferase [Flavobacterium sp.]